MSKYSLIQHKYSNSVGQNLAKTLAISLRLCSDVNVEIKALKSPPGVKYCAVVVGQNLAKNTCNFIEIM